jgi:fatty acid desaturase
MALALFRAGYDPRDLNDMEKLSDVLRNLREAQERADKRSSRRSGFALAALTAGLTVLVTWATSLGTWVTHLLPLGWWHPGSGPP